MSGQRRANWRTEMDAVIGALEARVSERIDGEDMWRRNEFVALRARLERTEFNLRLAFLALAIVVTSTVIQAVSR